MASIRGQLRDRVRYDVPSKSKSRGATLRRREVYLELGNVGGGRGRKLGQKSNLLSFLS